ncbi:uncharacterized protein isoform X1 [Rhodnius prolixus]|uniref:uncharacterized protein isoform X1 n=2 Tax=Rhodnius prolixus TaxID=13249 RepID=UPI003D18C949
MRLLQIYVLIGAVLYVGGEANNRLNGIMQLQRVMQLEPHHAKKVGDGNSEKEKREMTHDKKNGSRQQRQYPWSTNEQYAQLLQQYQSYLKQQQQQQQQKQYQQYLNIQQQPQQYALFHYVQPTQSTTQEEDEQKYEQPQQQQQQYVNQGHQSQYGIQYLTQLLQQYETQARLNYYLQQAGLGDYQAQTNQAVGQALQQQSGPALMYYSSRRPTMPVYHYSPLPKGTFKEERDQLAEQEQVAKTSPQSMKSVGNQYGAGLGQYSNNDDQADWNNDNEEDAGEYDFGYRVSDHSSGLEMGKVETKENGLTRGSYHVLLPDGRLQVVNYWSDHTGYHTDIRYHTHPH